MHQEAHALALPRIVALPSADAEFGRWVRQAARDLADVPAIERRIRSRYPQARLRASELSGRDAVLYAYRDGRWEPPSCP